MDEYREEIAVTDFWLKVAVVICFFIAAVSVLDAFINVVMYVSFLLGSFEQNNDPDIQLALLEIQKNSGTFLLFNLYNIVLWNAVIVCTIWLLRYHDWARITLRSLLGFDMLLTVVHLLWNASQQTGKINAPGWFILLNTLQVAAIVIISHPAILERVERESLKRKLASKESEDPLS